MVQSTNLFVSEIVKFWYKRFNKSLYYDYKLFLKDQKLIAKYTSNFEIKLNEINNSIFTKKTLNFKHSGHIGDLMYALPVIKELSKEKTCNLFINLNQQFGKTYYKHPSGNIMISKKIYEMLLPLLESQEYINKVSFLDNEDIDVDLDYFRDFPFTTNFHSIRWYYHLVNKQVDMAVPFLKVNQNENFKNKVVIVRSHRGRNPLIDYSFLTKFDELLFLGTKIEYDDFVLKVPNTVFYDVPNFLELAQIMSAARLVITNQTFAFSIAEGLKVNRLLESNPYFPVVFPIGGNGYDFYFQKQFESQVSLFLEK